MALAWTDVTDLSVTVSCTLNQAAGGQTLQAARTASTWSATWKADYIADYGAVRTAIVYLADDLATEAVGDFANPLNYGNFTGVTSPFRVAVTLSYKKGNSGRTAAQFATWQLQQGNAQMIAGKYEPNAIKPMLQILYGALARQVADACVTDAGG